MKHKFLMLALLAMFTLGILPAWGQVGEYSFSATTGTFTPITGGVLLGTETSDDQRFVDPATPAGGTVTTGPGLDIGFNFTFNGAVFDRLAINNNGWISLGQSALTPSVNNTSSSAYTPIASTSVIDPPCALQQNSGLGQRLAGANRSIIETGNNWHSSQSGLRSSVAELQEVRNLRYRRCS